VWVKGFVKGKWNCASDTEGEDRRDRELEGGWKLDGWIS
jgi:hypothetical protein